MDEISSQQGFLAALNVHCARSIIILLKIAARMFTSVLVPANPTSRVTLY